MLIRLRLLCCDAEVFTLFLSVDKLYKITLYENEPQMRKSTSLTTPAAE